MTNTKESELNLMTCRKCGEKLVMEVNILGEKKIVPISCKCQQSEYKKRKEDEAKKEMQKKLDKLRKYSLMNSKFFDCTFETYDIDKQNSNLYKIALNYCKQWPDMKKEGIGLMFWGTPGTGKSHTSFCIANELMKNLTPVIAISSIGLIGKIYDSYRKYGTEGEYEIINTFNNADLLIIDDLGSEHESHGGKEKQILYSVIDTRIRNGKPMIVTTNLTLLQLKDKLTYDDGVPRTYDRLIEMCTPIQIEGPSRRVISARKKQKEVLERLLKD
ncbi:AAA family ATPase [Tissierella sp. P1]|nr:AAA family ATPase [Tissierella sp. P1]